MLMLKMGNIKISGKLNRNFYDFPVNSRRHYEVSFDRRLKILSNLIRCTSKMSF
jgi:hypothetical protein